jgi:predicted MFS family arabinose efflux permease
MSLTSDDAPHVSPSRPRSRAREWLRLILASAPRGQFWFFFLASVFFNTGFSIFYFLFNIYLLDFGWTERTLGLVNSLLAAGSIAGTIPVGKLIERIGLRRTLTLGIALAVVFSVLRTCVLWPPAQIGLALLCGVAMCTWAVCLSPAVAALTPENQRPFAFSVMFASGISIAGLGGLAAGHLPGWLLASGSSVGWRSHLLGVPQANRWTLLIGCGIVALALLPLSRIVLATPAPQVRQRSLSTPFLWRFLPAIAVWGLVTGAFPPFANVYLVHHLGLSLARTGFVFSISQLAQFVAILAAPLLFRRAGLTSGVMLTQLATAGCLLWLASAHSPQLASWVYWVYMAVQCMNEPGIFSVLMAHSPEQQRSRASAATFFVSSTAQAIAALGMGWAIVRIGYPSSLAAIAGLAVVAAILFRRVANDAVPTPALPSPPPTIEPAL